ncbi:MAG: hypothetical protein FWF29_09815 [Treponema sp.]|nr:hypothetical protein [Treponema sp.]
MKRKGLLFLAGGIVLVLAAAAALFYFRSPVLVVSDDPFTLIYGKQRILIQEILAMARTGRRVEQVIISDSAGPDILILALEKASKKPWRVIFPYRYEDAAKRYHEQFPGIACIVLYGRALSEQDKQAIMEKPGTESALYEFFTDTSLDLYRAGRFASVIAGSKTGNIPVFINKLYFSTGKDAFAKGFGAAPDGLKISFYDSYSQLGVSGDFPVVALAGSGMEYLDKNPRAPLILFTWLAPSETSHETYIIMDDSVWAQFGQAMKMVKNGVASGFIPSKPLIFSSRIADNVILRQLRKAAGSGMEQDPAQVPDQAQP